MFHSPVASASVCDRRPDLHRHFHGSPAFLTHRYPGGAGHHPSGFVDASFYSPICLWKSHGHAYCLRGDSVECGGFLLQMALYIEMQPQKFPTEWSKVAFLISLLSGRALLWARAIWNANSVIINGYEDFTNHFKCSARLPEHSRSRISYCACARALLPPTSTPCNSELWLRLVDGMRWLFSAPTKIGVTKHLFVTAEGAALA